MGTVAGFVNVQLLLIVLEMSIVIGMVTILEIVTVQGMVTIQAMDCDSPIICPATSQDVAWPQIMLSLSTKPLYNWNRQAGGRTDSKPKVLGGMRLQKLEKIHNFCLPSSPTVEQIK